MVGCKCLISNVGITTLVKVSPSRVSPNFSLTILWRYFPSYLGPLTKLDTLLIGPAMPLQLIERKKKLSSIGLIYNSAQNQKLNLKLSCTANIYIFAIACEERTSNQVYQANQITYLVGKFEGSAQDRRAWYPWRQREDDYFHLEQSTWRLQDHQCLSHQWHRSSLQVLHPHHPAPATKL